MEKKSVFERLFEWIRGWLRRLLRVLFQEDVLDHIRQAHAESDSSGADETAIGTDPPELTEEERRRMMETPVERRRICFYGRVQGVGFRYHLMQDARNQGLTGWVRNLADGSVEAEIQGPSAAIDYVILNLGKGRWIRVEAMDSEKIPVVEGERGFKVTGYY